MYKGLLTHSLLCSKFVELTLFTFGYHDGVFARLTPKPASCIDNKPQADGCIDVKVLFGNPSYCYEVRAESVSGLVTDSIVQSGLMTTDHATIKKLLPGIYHVDVIQSKHPTLAAFVWASSFTTFARKTLCLYSTKQMFFGFVALQ